MRSRFTNEKRRGFTLLELLIIMAIIGIVLAAGGPELYRLLNKAKVEGALKCSAVVLRKARMVAVTRNVETNVQMVAAGGLTKMLGTGGPGLDIECTLPPNIEVWSFTGFQNLDRPEQPGVAIFRGDGSAVEAGAFRYDDSRGNSVRVQVSPAAIGRVQTAKLQGGGWHARDQGKSSWLWF